MTAPAISPARTVALRHIERQASRYPEFALGPPDTEGLDHRDAALTHALCDTCVRRFLTLETVIHAFLRTRLDRSPPPVQSALLVGAAQLLFFDRIPAHAAIDESVEYAKSRAPRASGLVNAVLRNLAREAPDAPITADPRDPDPCLIPLGDGRARRTTKALLPEHDPARLAAACSVPLPLLRRWADLFGRERATDLALHTLVVPPVIVNARSSRTPPPSPEFTPHEQQGMYVWAGPGRDLAGALSSLEGAWVQDPASAAPVEMARAALDPARVRTIIDLCAGQGTKTRQLAAAFPDARIIATDLDDERRRELARVARQHPSMAVVDPDQIHPIRFRADLVLLDVPCSNSAVLPRRPEAKYRWSEEQLARLVEIQQEVLRVGMELCTDDGSILYATCSLDPEENEMQTEWCRAQGWEFARDERRWPAGLPGEAADGYSDGSYGVLLHRRRDGGYTPPHRGRHPQARSQTE